MGPTDGMIIRGAAIYLTFGSDGTHFLTVAPIIHCDVEIKSDRNDVSRRREKKEREREKCKHSSCTSGQSWREVRVNVMYRQK